MNLSQAEIALIESSRAEGSAAREADLAEAILNRAASYAGPLETPAGVALWAIQGWYAELGDEARAQELLQKSQPWCGCDR